MKPATLLPVESPGFPKRNKFTTLDFPKSDYRGVFLFGKAIVEIHPQGKQLRSRTIQGGFIVITEKMVKWPGGSKQGLNGIHLTRLGCIIQTAW